MFISNHQSCKYYKLSRNVFLALVLLAVTAQAAVYSSGQSNKKHITDLYREIIVVESGDSLYTAQQFGGGYIGLAGSKNVSDHFVNFSIWDNRKGDLNFVVEGPDPRLGGTVERFGNEGTGAKTTTKLRWKFDVLYKTYVKVEHIDGGSLLSGWINEADSPDWYRCGRIFIPNTKIYLGNGTLFLETLSDHAGRTGRKNGGTLGWVRNSTGWAAMTGLWWSCQTDKIDRASGYNTKKIHYLTFEQNNKAPWYPKTSYQVPPGMIPTPSTAPKTMPGYEGPIKNITTCPAHNAIPKFNWSLHTVDSEQSPAGTGSAASAFDGNPATYWHTQWRRSSPSHPHWIAIDLGAVYNINGFSYLPRRDSRNGYINNYKFYVSTDGINWGSPVSAGSWGGVTGICQKEAFPSHKARYVKLVALSEINQNPWTSIAELNVYQFDTDHDKSHTSGVASPSSDTKMSDNKKPGND